MTVDTRSIAARRQLTFHSLDDIVAEASRLVSSPTTRTLGNWPLERLLTHLASAINHSIDGFAAKAPWFIRVIGPLLKRRILTKPMAPGFKLPKDVETGFFPAAASAQAALKMLRTAVARTQHEKMSAKHPVLGKLTHAEWAQLHQRHAEMHLGFAVPGEA